MESKLYGMRTRLDREYMYDKYVYFHIIKCKYLC